MCFLKLQDFKNKSRIILALDFPDYKFSMSLLNSIQDFISGVKIGLPFLLGVGINKVKRLISAFSKKLFFIADLKLADVSHVESLVIESLKEMKFSGIIAHAFTGISGSLEESTKRAKELDIQVFLVVAMSHIGAEEILNRNFDHLLKITIKVDADGCIAPATNPTYIKRAREYLGEDYLILSPGIGAQGAPPGMALKNGADFEIIGRMIVKSTNPINVVRDILKKQKETLKIGE